MVLSAASLAGDDAMTPLRLKAWEALNKWITWRCSRQRGVHVPNLFQIFWQTTSTEGTSKLKRPVFMLSPRFCENNGVRRAKVPAGPIPAPVSGDDINFYNLSIQFSTGLTKDQAFVATRDMLFKLGEAAGQGRELQLDLGAGVLTITDREATFEWAGGLGAGGVSEAGGRKATSSLDPLSGRRRDGSALSGLHLSGTGARSGLFGSECSTSASRLSGAAVGRLSADEEARLFSEVDRLDPEGRAEATSMRVVELEQPTKAEIGRLLSMGEEALAEHSVEELGLALGAKAAALEAQLQHSKTQNAKLERELNQASTVESRRLLPGQPSGRRQDERPMPSSRAAAKPAQAFSSLSIGGKSTGGGSRLVGGSKCSLGNSAGAARSVGSPPPAAPLLSVGFGGSGPAAVSVGRVRGPGVVPKPKPSLAAAKLNSGPPAVQVHLSAPPSDITVTTARVPVAPPIRMHQYMDSDLPNDAATVAWRLHAAPVPPAVQGPARGPQKKYGRSVGGLAPPFLPVPVSQLKRE